MRKLTHLDHPEDLLFIAGSDGAYRALDFLTKNDEHQTKLKIDGSPSIVAGLDDFGAFFVSTKSFFNQTPILNYTAADVKKNHSNVSLQNVLISCLAYLPSVVRGGIFQGDLLYSNNFGRSVTEDYVEFKPNTISYRAYDSDEIDVINKSSIGIAWHTAYAGKMNDNTFNMTEFNRIDLHEDPLVYQYNTDFEDPYEVGELTHIEQVGFDAMKANIYKKIYLIDGYIGDKIFRRDTDISKLAMMFINDRIRRDAIFYNTEEILFDFLNFIDFKCEQKIKKLKTEKAAYKKAKEAADIKKYILLTPDVRQLIGSAFEIHSDIMNLKNFVIAIMERGCKDSPLQPYIKDVKVNHEGFVRTFRLTNEMVKFVNRSEFSKANFENKRYR